MKSHALLALSLLCACLAAPVCAQKPLRLVHGDVDPLAQPLPALEGSRAAAQPAAARILQFDRPVDARILQAVKGHAEVLEYLPGDALVVRGLPTKMDAAENLPEVRWAGDLSPALRVHPDVKSAIAGAIPAEATIEVEARLLPGADTFAFEQAVALSGGQILRRRLTTSAERYLLRLSPSQMADIASHPAVHWLEPAPVLTRRNTTTQAVIQSDTTVFRPAWDHGLTGQGQIIGHIDGQIDMASCYFHDPNVAVPGPTHRKVVAYYESLDRETHGTHTAGTAAGWNVDGSLASAGIAYQAKLVHGLDTGVGNFQDQPLFGGEITLEAAFLRAQADGAFIHTNSWGDDSRTSYTLWCRDIDKFSHENEDALVVFAATNLSALKTPENAKNVLAVGATWQAPSQNLISTGGTGPTSDGRRKPEIFTPGRSINSARSGSACSTTSLTGTSMACPAIAGAAALARQYYMEGFHPSGAANPADSFTPSGALLKATLLNGTVDMTGAAGYPSNAEGWGRLVLDNALHFEGEARRNFIAEARNAEGLLAGESRTFTVTTSEAGPLAVTMVFTDFPAAHLSTLTPVSNLDLEVVSAEGLLFKGNVFSGGVSIPSGRPDGINNVERVVLPSAPAGEWTLRVKASATPLGAQGFALVATGQGLEATASPTGSDGWLIF